MREREGETEKRMGESVGERQKKENVKVEKREIKSKRGNVGEKYESI